MSTTTLKYNAIPSKYPDNTGKYWMDRPQTLAANGDILVIRYNWQSQISSFSGISQDFTGVTATRTLTQEFRYSTIDNPAEESDWSDWATRSGANYAGLSLDAENLLFIEERFTRGGTDDTGEIVINWLEYSFSYTPTASEPAPAIDWETTEVNLPDIIEAMVTEMAPTKSNGINDMSALVYHYGHPEGCEPDESKGIVYMYAIRYGDAVELLTTATRRVEFEIGIRTNCDRESTQGREQMKGRICHRMGLYADQFKYEAVVNGVRYIGVNPHFLNVRNMRVLGQSQNEYLAPNTKCGCVWWRAIIEFKSELNPNFIQ